jgi:hypothetical protein
MIQNVTNACEYCFLTILEEDVYVRQPPGFGKVLIGSHHIDGAQPLVGSHHMGNHLKFP